MRNKAELIMSLVPIWAGFFGTSFFYGWTIYSKEKPDLDNPIDDPDAMIVSIYCSMAVISLLVAIFLVKHFIKNEKDKLNIKDSSFNLDEVLNRFIIFFIVRYAFINAFVTFGFALSYVAHNITYYIPFLLIASIIYIYYFPTKEKIKMMIASA